MYDRWTRAAPPALTALLSMPAALRDYLRDVHPRIRLWVCARPSPHAPAFLPDSHVSPRAPSSSR